MGSLGRTACLWFPQAIRIPPRLSLSLIADLGEESLGQARSAVSERSCWNCGRRNPFPGETRSPVGPWVRDLASEITGGVQPRWVVCGKTRKGLPVPGDAAALNIRISAFLDSAREPRFGPLRAETVRSQGQSLLCGARIQVRDRAAAAGRGACRPGYRSPRLPPRAAAVACRLHDRRFVIVQRPMLTPQREQEITGQRPQYRADRDTRSAGGRRPTCPREGSTRSGAGPR